MFCSNCGKTIPAGGTFCPGCGKEAGNSPLADSNITSAQSIIPPQEISTPSSDTGNQDKYEETVNYTRTTYTSMSRSRRESGEIDSRTSYRPVYKGSVPDNVRDDMLADLRESRARVEKRDEDTRQQVEHDKARVEKMLSEDGDILEEEEPVIETDIEAENERSEVDTEDVEPEAETIPAAEKPVSEATQEKIDALTAELQSEDEEIDMSQFKARPIETKGRAALSQDVSDYLRRFEEDQQKRKAKRKPRPIEDDLDEDPEDIEEEAPAPVRSRRATRAARAKSDAVSEDIDSEAETKTDDSDNKPGSGSTPEEDGEADQDNIDDIDDLDDFDDEDLELDDDDHRSVIGIVLKVVAAVAVVAAIAFGIVHFVGNFSKGVSSTSAKIEGVSTSVYDGGIELIKSHNTDSYRSELLSQYNSGGVLAVSNTLEADKAEIQALMPEEPSVNDATFIQAIVKIQDNISSAILMDAMSDGSAEAQAESANRWSIINNSITTLESITSAAELTGIINGETITVHNETPAPTSTPIVYTALQKGDENNDVLKLQTRLFQLGWLEGDLDGAFGGKTQTAVKRFQQAAGLSETGIADSEMQNLLYSDSAPYAPGAVTPSPVPAAATATPAPVEAPVTE